MAIETDQSYPSLLARLLLPAGLTLLALGCLVTGLHRVGVWPEGLLNAEAAHGVLARESAGRGLAIVREAGDRSPLLAAQIAAIGRERGFDVVGVRLAATAAWIGAVVLTALWARREVGPGWALVMGLIVASSLWPIVFGRLALSPVAGMLALAALLTLLQEAMHPSRSFLWYVPAGLAAGVALMADPALRVLPLLLIVALLMATRSWYAWHGADPRLPGLVVVLLTAGLVATPYLAGQLSRLTEPAFWAGTPGLPIEPASSGGEIARNYGSAMARLVWPGEPDPILGLPGDPIFSPFLAPWAVLGLLLALRDCRNLLYATAVCWGALLILPAALATPVHPGRLVVALPLLAILPIVGLRALLSRARSRSQRAAAFLLIGLTLAGHVVWSGYWYAGLWPDARPPAAFSPGTVAALQAAARLPAGEVALVSTYGRDDLLEYLGDRHGGRIDFDGRRLLPLPSDRDGFLLAPEETPPDPALLRLFEGMPARAGAGYTMYRFDDRVRDRLPFSVPTSSYTGGLRFLGYELEPAPDGRLAVKLAWEIPEGASGHRLRLRLQPVDQVGAGLVAEAPLPGDLVYGDHQLVVLAWLPAPPAELEVDLLLSVLDPRGRPLAGDGVDMDGELLLNRYVFVR